MQGVGRTLEAWVELVPDWGLSALLLSLAILVGLFAHTLIVTLVCRTLGGRTPAIGILVRETSGPARLALALAAVNLTFPLLPYETRMSDRLSRLLLLAFIALVGWFAIRLTEAAAQLYLRRFASESADSLMARKHVTQVRILTRAMKTLIVTVTISAMLMTFEPVRQYGVSLFASAGFAGLVVGLAARPLLANLFAGIQLAITQPIRMGDVVLVENQWGTVEEISSAYVSLRLLDARRLIVPLAHFIEKPFQNWTRDFGSLSGALTFSVPPSVRLATLRERVQSAARASAHWDGNLLDVQVSDLKEAALQIQVTVSARSYPDLMALHSELRACALEVVQNRDARPAAEPVAVKPKTDAKGRVGVP